MRRAGSLELWGIGVLAIGVAGCGGDAAIAEGSLRDWGPKAELVPPCDGDTPVIPAVEGALCTDDGWCWESEFPTGTAPHDLARVGNEIWARSELGLLRYDGKQWTLDGRAADHLVGSADGSAFLATRREVSVYSGTEWRTWESEEWITGIAGSPESTMWVVIEGINRGSGEARPALLRLDGEEWVLEANLQTPLGGLLAVRSAQDIWVDGPGYVNHFDGTSWTKTSLSSLVPGIAPDAWAAAAIHVAGEHDVWLSVGTGSMETTQDGELVTVPRGALFRHDGTEFVNVPGAEDFAIVTEFEGTDAADVWMGTGRGEVLHWDGSTLSHDGDGPADRPLSGFARAGDGRLFATYSTSATNGIVEREGGVWNDHALTGPTQVATKVWGSAWNDVWAIGTDGLRLHFDGEGWRAAEPARGDVTDIWGRDARDVWTISRRGDIDHFDGRKWTTLVETGYELVSLWGLGEGELWITVNEPSLHVGVLHFVRGRMETFPDGAGINGDVWASSSTDVYVAMGGFRAYMHYDGKEWKTIGTTAGDSAPPFSDVIDFWGRAADDVYVLDTRPNLYRFDGTDWSLITSAEGFRALNGCGDALFASGGGGLGLLEDGGWDRSMQQGRDITGFWAASDDFGIAVGTGGKIIRRAR